MKRQQIESQIQKRFIEWCSCPAVLRRWPHAVIDLTDEVKVGNRKIKIKRPMLAFYHPANGEARNDRTGAQLKKMGVRRGVLDLVLPVPRGPFCGLVLELKRPSNGQSKKGYLSPDQRAWKDFLERQGHKVSVVYSFDECVRETEIYLNG